MKISIFLSLKFLLKWKEREFFLTRYLNDLEKFSAEVSEIEKKIGDLIEGETINLRSSKQVGHLLFDILELPTVKKTKKQDIVPTQVFLRN